MTEEDPDYKTPVVPSPKTEAQGSYSRAYCDEYDFTSIDAELRVLMDQLTADLERYSRNNRDEYDFTSIDAELRVLMDQLTADLERYSRNNRDERVTNDELKEILAGLSDADLTALINKQSKGG